jgi:ATP-dependent Clp protease adapter protein ClpS
MSLTIVERESSTVPRTERPWKVTLYNCDCHTFDDVILSLQRATGCSLEKASFIANEAHFVGRAIAYEGPREECLKVRGLLTSAGLRVDMDNA